MAKKLALRRCSRLREFRLYLAMGSKLKSKIFNFDPVRSAELRLTPLN